MSVQGWGDPGVELMSRSPGLSERKAGQGHQQREGEPSVAQQVEMTRTQSNSRRRS